MKEVWTHIHNFLVTQSIPTILREIQNGGLMVLAKSVYAWLVAGSIVIYLLWTRKFKAIIALASLVLFVLLIQKTLAQPGNQLDLTNVLLFIGGTTALIGFNLYLLFVRD